MVRRERRDGGVVHAHQGWWGNRTVRVRVRAGHAHAGHGVGTVTNAVTVGVGVERVRARVRAVDVVTGARLNAVVQTVAVVVAVGHKTGGWAFGGIVIARQIVGQAVAVVIRKAPQVEREGLGGAAVVGGGHGVGGVGQRSVDRAGDFAG